MSVKTPLAERFWGKVKKAGADECWEWQAYRTRRGYGAVRSGARAVAAHRIAYELAVGPILGGLYVCHHCDNPPCCNPAHLFLGTQKDNIGDAAKKGRLATGNRSGAYTHPETRHGARGNANKSSKLNVDKVRAIRTAYDAGTNRHVLAKNYGVTWRSIELVVSGRSWAHVAFK